MATTTTAATKAATIMQSDEDDILSGFADYVSSNDLTMAGDCLMLNHAIGFPQAE